MMTSQSVTDYPELFILRHGQTVWNKAGKFQGRRDSPLTALGRAQALRQRAILDGFGMVPSLVYSSPQGRALATARLIFGDDVPIRMDDRLQEIDFGLWEGKTRDEVHSEIDGAFDEAGQWQFNSPGGEDLPALMRRARDFLDALPGPAIIVSHGTLSIVLRGICMALSEAEMLALPKEQGCVYHVEERRQTVLR